LGCMGMSAYYGAPVDEAAGIKLIHRALELGCNFFDTAHGYGWGANEELLGKAIRQAIAAGKIKREDVIIATKFGVLQGDTPISRVVSSKPADVRKVTEICLKKLDLGHIDLLYQHRVDPNTPIEETVGAMVELIKEGKVKYLGLSEASEATLRRAHKVHPISALQSEFSLWSTDAETNGTLAACHELGITFVAYAPLGRGFLTGSIKTIDDFAPDDFRRTNPRFQGENFGKNLVLVEEIKKLAHSKGVTAGQLALAWVLKQGIVAIPGTTRIPNLEENLAAAKITVTEEDGKAIRKLLSSIVVVGERYAAQMAATLNH